MPHFLPDPLSFGGSPSFPPMSMMPPIGTRCEFPRTRLLGPSVSSRGERNAPRICDERTVHSIRDASLEAAHRLPARLALRQLLTMVRPATRIASSLADRNHVHDLVEATVPGQ